MTDREPLEVIKQGEGWAWVKPRKPKVLDLLQQITVDLKRVVEEEKQRKQGGIPVDNPKS